jgi:hypothetical protein
VFDCLLFEHLIYSFYGEKPHFFGIKAPAYNQTSSSSSSSSSSFVYVLRFKKRFVQNALAEEREIERREIEIRKS